MKFTTEVSISKPDFAISHSNTGLAIGSCFTTYIGEHLNSLKFPISVNPLRTIYNPVSIAQSIEILIGNKTIHADDLFLEQGVWQSFYLHTKLSDVSKIKVIENVRAIQDQVSQILPNLTYIIISLGTSWVYKHKTTNILVNNCHKQPTQDFERYRLEPAEIVETLSKTIELLRSKTNNTLQVVFTVSPIRHSKDGAFGNNVSKAALLLAIDELLQLPNTYYFPAYEIVLDELRDYRFYAQDMMHPSDTAIAYIFEKFGATFFTSNTLQVCKTIEAISKAILHKPFNASSIEYTNFIKSNIEECYRIMQQNSHIDLHKEIERLQNNMSV